MFRILWAEKSTIYSYLTKLNNSLCYISVILKYIVALLVKVSIHWVNSLSKIIQQYSFFNLLLSRIFGEITFEGDLLYTVEPFILLIIRWQVQKVSPSPVKLSIRMEICTLGYTEHIHTVWMWYIHTFQSRFHREEVMHKQNCNDNFKYYTPFSLKSLS